MNPKNAPGDSQDPSTCQQLEAQARLQSGVQSDVPSEVQSNLQGCADAAPTVLLVLTNLPDRDSAERLAGALIENKLAACVNILAPVLSVYHWQGKTETATEIQLQIKTTVARYPALQQCVQAMHPYQLPEIVALKVSDGLPAYLNWVQQETGSR